MMKMIYRLDKMDGNEVVSNHVLYSDKSGLLLVKRFVLGEYILLFSYSAVKFLAAEG